ncbi:unnamed protein product [Dicrocoelium dendriticum]|nr:unnamed protein product [Dicrocoelium dendriticum]
MAVSCLSSGFPTATGQAAEEVAKIERPGSPIIWKISWSPSKSEHRELLAVLDWNQKLSLYQPTGKQVGKDRNLSFDPCGLSWFGSKHEMLAICGSDGSCALYNLEGNRLAPVTRQQSWIWCCCARPGRDQITVGCQDGSLETIQLSLNAVHSVYRDRYAYRESLTDVVVQHLVTQQKARIKCRDYVRNISVYKNRLAIQLPDKILIYEPSTDQPTDMHYRIREKLIRAVECQSLLVTTHNLILCQANKLTLLNFQGVKEREWSLDDAVQYMRIIGGPPTKETVLAGMKNGQVIKVILDNAFPIHLVSCPNGIRCVDVSRNRDKLGVIDDSGTLSIFCLRTKDLLFQEPAVLSLAWSTTDNELLSYSGDGVLFIKAGQCPSYAEHVKGVTVGFCGSYVYCLQENLISIIEVSLSPAMYYYIEAGSLHEAQKMARHGLTDPDWTALGRTALNKLNLEVAKYAYLHLGAIVMLTFIQQLEDRRRRSDWDEKEVGTCPASLVAMGDVAAYNGNFAEAASFYSRAGSTVIGTNRTVEMYCDLRRFDDAKESMSASGDSSGQRLLIRRHADWARSTNDHHKATKMYVEIGEYAAAIELAGEHAWTDILLEVSRRLDKGDRDCLEMCASHLARLGEYAFAADCYAKYGDVEKQVALQVEARNWDEAFSLAEKYPEYVSHVYLPYAQWLAENDRFEEAQIAFAKAGFRSEAIRVLEQLALCAANLSRFEDAAFYHWKLSMQCLEMARDTNDRFKQLELLDNFSHLQQKADIYYVYSNIHRHMHEPFTSQMPEAYFNMARYLANLLQTNEVNAVSKAAVLYTLARHGKTLGGYKLARCVYDQLQHLHMPYKMTKAVELASLDIRSKPLVDSEEVNVICYRCSTTNPLLNATGNRCTHCGEPFVYSFISFEQLPLVEFIPEESLSHEKVLELLKFDPCPQTLKANGTYGKKNGRTDQSVSQTLKVSSNFGDATSEHDPFTAKLLSADLSSGPYKPVCLDEETLRHIPASEVIILERPSPLRPRYYKSILPEIGITQCFTCHKLFNTDDYELAVLQKGHCPFCRTSRE